MVSKIKQIPNKFLIWSSQSVSNLILTSVVFFIFGIAVASIFVSSHLEDFYFFIISCFLFVVLAFLWRKKWFRLVLFCVLFFILGLWRYSFSLPATSDIAHIKNYNNQLIEFVGIISDEPDKRNDHYKLTIDVQQVSLPTKLQNGYENYESDKISGLVLLRAPLYPEYKYGDKLQVTCKIKNPQIFDDFDYAAYLSRYNIYSVCSFPKEIRLIERNQGNIFYASIYSLKEKFAKIGGKILPEPHASFLAALVYGARQGIPQEMIDQFNRTALTHIIAISGYNISLVIGILLPIFTLMFFSRKRAFPLVVLGIVFFVIFAGASASVVRAGIMGIIAALANNTSRMSRSGRILIFVGFLMLLFNPKLLFFDRGFTLSFAAAAGLIYLAPIIKNYFKWWRKGIYFRRIVEETLSATIATLPLVMYYFDRISTVTLVANIFVLPIIPMIMLFGFIALVGGLIWQGLGFILAVIPWILINYIFKITEFFASFNLASISLGRVFWIVPVILYGILISWMVWVKKPKKETVEVVDKEVEEYKIEIDNNF